MYESLGLSRGARCEVDADGVVEGQLLEGQLGHGAVRIAARLQEVLQEHATNTHHVNNLYNGNKIT